MIIETILLFILMTLMTFLIFYCIGYACIVIITPNKIKKKGEF